MSLGVRHAMRHAFVVVVAMYLISLPAPAALAQAPPPPLAPSPASSPSPAPSPLPRLLSPEVHPDRTVTFRFRAPTAKEVLLDRSGKGRTPMQRDEAGVW